MRFAWILALTLAIGPLAAQETGEASPRPELAKETRVPVLVNSAVAAYQEKDFETMQKSLERAVELRPHLAHLRFLLAKAYALQDKKRQAYDALVRLQSQGLSLPLAGDDDFENLRGYQLYDYLVEQFAKNAEPYGQTKTAFTIPRTDLLIEAMAHDPKRDRILVGSITKGTIFTVQDDGSLEPFIEPTADNHLLGVTSMGVDADSDVLWVTSAASAHVSHAKYTDRGVSFLHKFDLATGRELARFTPPAKPSYLIDLTLSPDGTVFVADTIRPVVWKVEAEASSANEDAEMDVFFAANSLTGIRTLTVDDTGENLYLADYELGVFGVAIEEQKPFEVHLGQALNLSGIDALTWYEDSLILVQNGVEPRRVLRFQLFPDHQRGRHVQGLVSAHEDFRNPTTAAVVGDRMFLIANSHRNAYDPASGQPKEGADLQPPKVLEFSLDYGWMPPPKGALDRKLPREAPGKHSAAGVDDQN